MYGRGSAYYRGTYRSRPSEAGVRAPHRLPPGAIGYVVPRPANGRTVDPIAIVPHQIPQEPEVDPGDRAPRFVIHLPFLAVSMERAIDVAYTLAQSLVFMPEVDAREVTVSHEDKQNERTRVFCDRLLDGKARCPERYGHQPPCGEEPAEAD